MRVTVHFFVASICTHDDGYCIHFGGDDNQLLGSRYDSDWLSIALFNSDHHHAEAAAKEVETKRISLQIMPNGSEWIELERNVPSGYCQYNLEALSTCADLSETLASSIWEFSTADGRSLRKSIDWLLPYATNATIWPYEAPGPQRAPLIPLHTGMRVDKHSE